jgi:NitT/TauT family transport system permease protein
MKLKPLIALLAFLVAWELVVRAFSIREFVLPPPTTILRTMWEHRAQLLQQSVPTLIEIWIGFAIAAAVGFLVAIPITYSKTVEETLFPILVGLQVVPTICLAPLFLIWLGFGMVTKIAIAALIAFFPVVVNTTKGLRSVEPEMVQWMRSLGARRRALFFKLALPSAMPYVMTALKVAITLAVVGAVVGELVGTDQGLGYVILRSTSELDTPLLFAVILTISLIGIGSYALVGVVERVLLSWQVAAEAGPETA